MRRLLAGCLSLPLGLLLSTAWAGERLPVPAAASGPVVSLGRPMPLAASQSPANPISPVSYDASVLGVPRPLVRAQSVEETPQRMPSGTGSDTLIIDTQSPRTI